MFLAGAPSHGSGEHEFNAGVNLLTKRLQEIGSVVVADYHDDGWPEDPTAMQNADALVVYADGLGSHPLAGHLQEVDNLIKKGVGLMCLHYAVHVEPGVAGEFFKRWIGGHYESRFSSNPHWIAELQPNPDHPITRDAKSGAINDEWYFSIRFSINELHYKIEIHNGKAQRPIFQSVFFEPTLNFGQNVGSEVRMFTAYEFVGIDIRVFL